jgi:hypothetical protein
MDARDRVRVRSYRGVVDEVERRIFRIDRWRLPTPHGVSVRALLYTLACLLVVLIAARLPLVGWIVGAIPSSARLVAAPALGGWLLASTRLDGRPPHHALCSAALYLSGPKTLAGLRRCPAVGSRLAPVDELRIAPSGDEPRFRRGTVRGPATLALRYPARIELDGVPRRSGSDPAERLATARRLRVTALGEGARTLPRARTLRIPEGKEVVFE